MPDMNRIDFFTHKDELNGQLWFSLVEHVGSGIVRITENGTIQRNVLFNQEDARNLLDYLCTIVYGEDLETLRDEDYWRGYEQASNDTRDLAEPHY